MHKKLTLLMPTFIVAILITFLMMALNNKDATKQTPIQHKAFPDFQLPALATGEQLTESLFTEPLFTESLESGYRLLNVWASWCVVCKTEHDFLMKLAAQNIDIVGLNYRDNNHSASLLLNKMGNPYQQVIVDQQGSLALDLGVVGTPESYLVNNQGMIVARFNGVLTEQVWATVFAPNMKATINKKTIHKER